VKPLPEFAGRPAAGLLAIGENNDNLGAVFQRDSGLVHGRRQGCASARYQRIDLLHDAVGGPYRRTEIELNVALIICPRTVGYETDAPIPGDVWRAEESAVAPLGLFGGVVDAIGGGGWGPIVTSTLLGQGTTPRYAIGSVNIAEFFVTLTISTTFFLTVGLSLWPIIAGLIIGGVIAAPFAAMATKHIPDKVLMLLVGCVVVLLSVRTILMALAPGP
jgi:hypothetical protein